MSSRLIWISSAFALLIAIIVLSVARDVPDANMDSSPGAGEPGSVLTPNQDSRPGSSGRSGEADPLSNEEGSIQGSTPALLQEDIVRLELPVDPSMRREIRGAAGQVPPHSDIDGGVRAHFSDPSVSNSGYSLETGFPSDPSLGPDASDTGELGLPPEASDPGILGPAPETGSPGDLQVAPEAGELPFQMGAPEASDVGVPGLPPEASDPGTMGPAPEASGPPN